MKNNKNYNRHYRNVQRETHNPVILNDVISSELEQYPGHNEKLMEDEQTAQVQEVARDNIDGKKWQNFDD